MRNFKKQPKIGSDEWLDLQYDQYRMTVTYGTPIYPRVLFIRELKKQLKR